MAVAVDQLPLRGTNCYIVRASSGAEEAVVVDPGDAAAEIRLALAARGARCGAILLTHAHYDHFGALAELAEGTGAPVWLPEVEERVVRRPQEWFPGIYVRPFEDEATLLAGGETVAAAGLELDAVAVPGHSPGHLAYHVDGCLFSGDLLFAGGVGRVDLPGGDWDTLLASIRALEERFGADAVVYPGHGPQTTLGAELARNPFLAELRA